MASDLGRCNRITRLQFRLSASFSPDRVFVFPQFSSEGVTMTGDEIRTARQKARLTQAQLGKLVGVTGRTVGNWERGDTMPQSTMALIQEVLSEHMKESEPEGIQLQTASDAELLAEIARRFSRGNRTRNDESTPGTPPPLSPAPEPHAQVQDEPQKTPGGTVTPFAPPIPDDVAAYHEESLGKEINTRYETLGEESQLPPDEQD
jgi:DNA-binding XRE family transcriptional regulator